VPSSSTFFKYPLPLFGGSGRPGLYAIPKGLFAEDNAKEPSEPKELVPEGVLNTMPAGFGGGAACGNQGEGGGLL
jgi:hypothetical protein